MYLRQQKRGGAKWYPDAKFIESWSGPVMYPDENTVWHKPNYNGMIYSKPLAH